MVEHQSPILLGQFTGVGLPVIQLGLGVLEHHDVIDLVSHDRVTSDFRLGHDPLLAVVGLRGGIDAVWQEQLSIHDDIRAGSAEVHCVTIVRSITAEDLHLDRGGEVLIPGHAFRGLPVQHHAAVSQSPAWTAGTLLTDKPILHSENVM